MALTLSIERGAFLRFTCKGDASLRDILRVLDIAARESNSGNVQVALFDLMEAVPHLSFSDHITLGACMAVELAHLKKVATAVHERYRIGTSEKAAQKTGLQLRTFTSVQEAIEWLES